MRILPILLVASAALLVAGCGGGDGEGGAPSVADARACLGELDLQVEDLPDDSDVESGLLASTQLTESSTPDDQFSFAMAARVTSDEAVDRFRSSTDDFAGDAADEQKLEVESGADGMYVWVAGSSDKDAVAAVRECVEP